MSLSQSAAATHTPRSLEEKEAIKACAAIGVDCRFSRSCGILRREHKEAVPAHGGGRGGMIAPGLLPRIWGLFLLVLVPGTREAPVGPDSSRDLVRNWEPVQQYLDKYGYLTPSPNGADNLRTEEKLRQAVRTMQRFGGITPTGVVDQDTLALLRRRRCGMPDVSQSDRVKRYAVQGQMWKNKNLTWSLKYLPSSMSEDQVRGELSRAFRLWSDVSLLSFQELRRNSPQADIVVSFERGKHGDGYAFDGPGVVLAHAFFPGEGIGGDAHFDNDEPWVDRERPGVDGVRLFAVAAHEFGHSLGLSHSSVMGALMNPFYQPIQDNFELPNDDQNGIQNLYGSRNPNKWAPLDPYIPRTARPPPTRPPYRPTFRPDTRPTWAPPRTREPPTAAPPRQQPDDEPDVPATCNTTFDAVSVIRNEIYFFKEKYFWRFVKGELLEGYPAKTSRFFYEKGLENIDAVYERTDRKIVFFSGPKYWVFDAHTKMPGYPRPLTDLGLPPDLKRIDAAMVWGHNGKTYLFSGKQYWRYDETEGRVELDYPRDMSMWRGVPYNIDAAFTNSSYTYFFKGRKFWKFDNARMKVENKTRRINEFWFRCPSRSEQAPDMEEEENDPPEKRERYVTSDSNLACFASNCVTAVSFAIVFLFYTARFILYL